MNPLQGAVRVVANTANAATAAAGAVGGAAVNGVVGGVQGTAQGIRNGVENGSHSTPAAALTFAALGVTGLVEWPVLLTVGGAAILVRQLTRQSDGQRSAPPERTAPTTNEAAKKAPAKRGPAKRAPAKRTPARKATSRRASSGRQP